MRHILLGIAALVLLSIRVRAADTPPEVCPDNLPIVNCTATNADCEQTNAIDNRDGTVTFYFRLTNECNPEGEVRTVDVPTVRAPRL